MRGLLAKFLSVAALVIYLLAGTGFAQDEGSFYFYGKDREKITPTYSHVSVVLGTTPSKEQVDEIRNVAVKFGFELRPMLSAGRTVFFGVTKGTAVSVPSFLKDIELRRGVELAFPAVLHTSKDVLLLSESVIVRYRSETSATRRAEIEQKFGVTSRRISEEFPVYLLMVAKKSSVTSPVALANRLTIDFGKDVEFAAPNFLRFVRLLRQPNDKHYGEQWTLKNVEAEAGWDMSVGDDKMRIAVLDDGVGQHPDLRIGYQYDAVRDTSSQEPNSWDGHGTAVAGLAAATGNNGGGITGVLWPGTIMAIRVVYTRQEDGTVISFDEWFVRGIRRAWENGADVLIMAWATGAPSAPIRDALDEAYRLGRKGLGSVLVAGAGNTGTSGIQFPANLANVIAVGAIDRQGKRWNYSPAGKELSVVAPSGDSDLKGDVITTDQVGGRGYGPGDYFNKFGGTSAAAAIAGGLAGLVLSVNGKLKAGEVKGIIQRTADDLGKPGVDDEYGHGRINIGRAVKEAKR